MLARSSSSSHCNCNSSKPQSPINDEEWPCAWAWYCTYVHCDPPRLHQLALTSNNQCELKNPDQFYIQQSGTHGYHDFDMCSVTMMAHERKFWAEYRFCGDQGDLDDSSVRMYFNKNMDQNKQSGKHIFEGTYNDRPDDKIICYLTVDYSWVYNATWWPINRDGFAVRVPPQIGRTYLDDIIDANASQSIAPFLPDVWDYHRWD